MSSETQVPAAGYARKTAELFLLLAHWSAVVFTSAALVALSYQLYSWLRFAVWPNLPLSETLGDLSLSYPRVGWPGAQSVIDLALRLPISLWLFVAGVVVTMAFLFAQAALEKSALRSERPRRFGS
jgi:hypothetical protein